MLKSIATSHTNISWNSYRIPVVMINALGGNNFLHNFNVYVFFFYVTRSSWKTWNQENRRKIVFSMDQTDSGIYITNTYFPSGIPSKNLLPLFNELYLSRQISRQKKIVSIPLNNSTMIKKNFARQKINNVRDFVDKSLKIGMQKGDQERHNKR